MIDDAVNNLLRATSGIDRVTPASTIVNVTEELPRIVYSPGGGEQPYTDDGAVGIVTAEYQIDVFADTSRTARAMLDKLARSANAALLADRGLDGFKDEVEGVKIQRIYFPTQIQAGTVAAQPGKNSQLARLFRSMRVAYYL